MPESPAQVRARMPLIDQIVAGALDEEYVEVAARRTGDATPVRPGLLAAVTVAVFAVLVTVSFRQTQDNERVVDAGRAELEDRIRARREVVVAAQDQIVRLRAQNDATQAGTDDLAEAEGMADQQVRQLSATAGFTAVSGPGIRLQVDDSPDGEPTDRVYDEDLALLVNGLWRAGASAISVNGYRLTVLSSFRFSGQAIRLNDVDISLSPPYTVLALGDLDTLAAGLADTTTGLRFQARVDDFGLVFTMQNEDRLSLPAALPRVLGGLRSAQVTQDGDRAAARGGGTS